MKLQLGFLITCCCVAAYAQGQSQGKNPFEDRSDTGEKIRILPTPASVHSPADTQPTDAPPQNGTAVYPASYGSGKLLDHGGLEIPNASFKPVYFNSSVANSSAPSGTLNSYISSFVQNFSSATNHSGAATDDYPIIQQYSSHATIASTINLLPSLVDSKSTVSRYSDSQIQSYLTGLFQANRLSPNSSTIYGIYFPAGMKICLQGGCSCSSFCGYHSHYTYGSTQIKYAVFPYPNCSGCSLSGKTAADMLTIVGSHEIREAVTDPGDFNKNAWYDASGYEADDKCAWHNLYQMNKGGFWVQPEYSNGGSGNYPGPGCVVPNR
jgi:hypothetical protein